MWWKRSVRNADDDVRKRPGHLMDDRLQLLLRRFRNSESAGSFFSLLLLLLFLLSFFFFFCFFHFIWIDGLFEVVRCWRHVTDNVHHRPSNLFINDTWCVNFVGDFHCILLFVKYNCRSIRMESTASWPFSLSSPLGFAFEFDYLLKRWNMNFVEETLFYRLSYSKMYSNQI